MAKFNPAKKRWLFAFIFSLIASFSWAQEVKDVNAHSPNPASSSRKEKQAQKKKAAQKKLAEKAIEKGRKNHEKLQTKEVRKRMRKSKHTASMNNAHQKEFFLKRWFTPKQRRKSR